MNARVHLNAGTSQFPESQRSEYAGIETSLNSLNYKFDKVEIE